MGVAALFIACHWHAMGFSKHEDKKPPAESYLSGTCHISSTCFAHKRLQVQFIAFQARLMKTLVWNSGALQFPRLQVISLRLLSQIPNELSNDIGVSGAVWESIPSGNSNMMFQSDGWCHLNPKGALQENYLLTNGTKNNKAFNKTKMMPQGKASLLKGWRTVYWSAGPKKAMRGCQLSTFPIKNIWMTLCLPQNIICKEVQLNLPSTAVKFRLFMSNSKWILYQKIYKTLLAVQNMQDLGCINTHSIVFKLFSNYFTQKNSWKHTHFYSVWIGLISSLQNQSRLGAVQHKDTDNILITNICYGTADGFFVIPTPQYVMYIRWPSDLSWLFFDLVN